MSILRHKSFLPPFRKYKTELYTKIINTGQFVHQVGESPNLRKPSNPVPIKEIDTPSFQKKIVYLKTCMLKYRKLIGVGRGITAVQVGIAQSFSVVYMPEEKGKPPVDKNGLLIIINPKITKQSKNFYAIRKCA